MIDLHCHILPGLDDGADSWETALEMGRMAAEAEALGADAIVCMRYASSSVMQGAAECIAYGTAVKFID